MPTPADRTYMNKGREREYLAALEQAAEDIQASRMLLTALVRQSDAAGVVIHSEELEGLEGLAIHMEPEGDDAIRLTVIKQEEDGEDDND